MALFDGWFGLDRWFGQRAKLTEPDGRAVEQRIAFGGPPVGPNRAMQLATVWSCVRLLSETIGTLPLGVYAKKADGSRATSSDHQLYSVLHDSPNADQSAVEFWESVVACLCLWGNFYAEKALDGAGRLAALNLVAPDRMNVSRDVNGARVYSWADLKGHSHKAGEAEIFHVRGFGIGLDTGLSPIGYARATLGAAIAADTSAAAAFQNGMRPSGLLIVDQKLSAEQRQDIRTSVLEPLTGPANNARAGVLEKGFDWKDIGGLPPEDMQLLETRAFHVEEICRWFRVPPFMVGHTEKSTSWGTGLEQQMIGFLTFSLRPYLSRIEQAVKKQLCTPADLAAGVYAEFNLEGLLRADSAGRAALYSSAGQNGWMDRDEIRDKENLPRRGGGAAKLTVQSALIPIDQLGQAPIGHNGGPELNPDAE